MIPRLKSKSLAAGQIVGAVLSSCMLAPGAAHAATGNVVFQGSITTNNSCAINVRQNGRLGISADYRTLSSKLAGGLVGIADVTAIGNFQISATTIPSFTVAPVGGNTNTTFQSLFSGASVLFGANFAERPGSNPVTLPFILSITRLNIHFVATRTGSSFPTGPYEGTVVVRCE